MNARRQRRAWLAGALVAMSSAALALIFWAYLRPSHIVDWLVMNSFCA